MSKNPEITYGSAIAYGAWAKFDSEKKIYSVRVIDNRLGSNIFIDVDMPERNKDGLRRVNVIHRYTTNDGYPSLFGSTTHWLMEDGSIELYEMMLNEVLPLPSPSI